MRVLTLAVLGLCGCGSAPLAPAPDPGPVAFKGQVMGSAAQTVSLDAGWNPVGLRGLPVTAVESSAAVGFASWNGTAYLTRPLTVAELNNEQGRGLWVYAAAAGALNYTAGNVSGVTTTELRAGWNLLAFPSDAPIPTSTLVARTGAGVVALPSVILPTFTQLNSAQASEVVDVTRGGTLLPGRAYWVYASGAVSLSWGASPTPVPSPSPSPTPPRVTSTLVLTWSRVGSVVAISDDGKTGVAQPEDAADAAIQDLDLVNNWMTSDPVEPGNPYRYLRRAACSADCSVTVFARQPGLNIDSNRAFSDIWVHRRETKASTLLARTFENNYDPAISADGTFCTYTSQSHGNPVAVNPCFQTVDGFGGNFADLFPALRGRRLFARGAASLSDDGSQVLMLANSGYPSRYTRLQVATGEEVEAVPTSAGVAVSPVQMSGNGRFVVYSNAPDPGSFRPVQVNVYLRHVGSDSPAELVSIRPPGPDAFNERAALAGGRSISSDGRFVLFSVYHTAFPADPNLFLRDRLREETLQVNVDERGARVDCQNPTMSRNGAWICFQQNAPGSVRRVRNPFL